MTEEKKKTSPEEKSEEKKDKKKAEREETAKIQRLEKELEEAHALLEKEKDSHLRLAAEYDNFKKRTAREKEDLFFLSKSEVIKTLLPVFDNLDRAAGASGQALEEGVKMILASFAEALGKMDVHEIEIEGKPFDPELCEAVFHEEEEGAPENTVAQVLQKGYVLKDKVIRHAMVKVVN